PEQGGGALWDVGCYGINCTRLHAGEEPTIVHALARRGPTGVDLTLAAELAFRGGVIGLVDCGFEEPFRCTYEIVGTRASVTVPDAYLPPRRPIAWLSRIDHKPRKLTFDGRDQYVCMIEDFARAVAGRGPRADLAEDGLAQMQALDAIRRAA